MRTLAHVCVPRASGCTTAAAIARRTRPSAHTSAGRSMTVALERLTYDRTANAVTNRSDKSDSPTSRGTRRAWGSGLGTESVSTRAVTTGAAPTRPPARPVVDWMSRAWPALLPASRRTPRTPIDFPVATGPQIQFSTGPVSPYVSALRGFSVFWKQSTVEGTQQDNSPFSTSEGTTMHGTTRTVAPSARAAACTTAIDRCVSIWAPSGAAHTSGNAQTVAHVLCEQPHQARRPDVRDRVFEGSCRPQRHQSEIVDRCTYRVMERHIVGGWTHGERPRQSAP